MSRFPFSDGPVWHGLIRDSLRRQHNLFDFYGMALRVDEVQVIDAVSVGLLLAEG